MKIYPTDHNEIKYLVHIDAYRLTSLADADSIGLSEVIDNKENVVLIEWPENVWPIIKNKSKSIKFLFIDKNSRQISY